MSTRYARLHIGHVQLVVHDLETLAAFYENALGLERISDDAQEVRLGVGAQMLVHLRRDRAARRVGPRDAGLFHTAFLLPERGDLGAWLHHAAANDISLEGASDHLVSEAVYLSDPEGNGIEIYRDRPRAQWPRQNGLIAMTTDPIDLQDVANSARAPWRGAPQGTMIGHVHLKVGALDAANAFYHELLGMPLMAQYPGANFYGWDGYHHHLATNIWHSRGAPAHTDAVTGLAEVGLSGPPEALADLRAHVGDAPVDPWGLRFNLSENPA